VLAWMITRSRRQGPGRVERGWPAGVGWPRPWAVGWAWSGWHG
jgi:hypothetical protein